ncbi:hypothetical protein [Rothia aerolata]|uniref:Uncharacterized protein n=1 Tax=Rothia aerolata TaxID=1812262 RepID=A0A917IVC1_9MICC|nr:hypothetical protein [Rothia aerolata]GGH64281.1 hypothetical protein GCM10007359_16440 [Rothia aerolata]
MFTEIREPSQSEPAFQRGKKAHQEFGFVQEHPGFFTTIWFPLFYLVSFSGTGLLPLIIALVGLYKNGHAYPKKYGVYSPLYFWLSVAFTLVPLVLLVLTMPG